MQGHIRTATATDVPAMVALSDEKRTLYEQYQPRFWRKATGAAEKQAAFFASLPGSERWVTLVHEAADGTVDGFLLADLVPAPPVYAPGGPILRVDDYWVAGGRDWDGTGAALLGEANREGHRRGAVLTIVVCGHRDEPKRAMLSACGGTIASEWWVLPIDGEE